MEMLDNKCRAQPAKWANLRPYEVRSPAVFSATSSPLIHEVHKLMNSSVALKFYQLHPPVPFPQRTGHRSLSAFLFVVTWNSEPGVVKGEQWDLDLVMHSRCLLGLRCCLAGSRPQLSERAAVNACWPHQLPGVDVQVPFKSDLERWRRCCPWKKVWSVWKHREETTKGEVTWTALWFARSIARTKFFTSRNSREFNQISSANQDVIGLSLKKLPRNYFNVGSQLYFVWLNSLMLSTGIIFHVWPRSTSRINKYLNK